MIKNLTPLHLRCAAMASCPSISQMDSGEYLIVGRSATMAAACEHIPVGEGEHAVIVSGELLAGVPRTWMAMDSAPKDGTKIDLLFPYPRGRVANCYWKGELGFTWVWKRATWGDNGELLPEDKWSISSFPNMEPLAWVPAISDEFPLPPAEKEPS